MIVVRVELWPGGDSSRAEDLGTAHIANESSLADISTYSVRLLKGSRYSRKPGDMWRTGEVRGYPRTSTLVGPWELLYMALKSALGNRVNRVEMLCREGSERAIRLQAKLPAAHLGSLAPPPPTLPAPDGNATTLLYAIGLLHTEDDSDSGPQPQVFTQGPSPQLEDFLAGPPDDVDDGYVAFIARLSPGGESAPIYVWDGEEWIPL